MFMDIDRYQLTMDGETPFNGEFYKNLFISVYTSPAHEATLIETRRYYLPKKDYIPFYHFLEECSHSVALTTIEDILKLPDSTRIKRIEVKVIPY